MPTRLINPIGCTIIVNNKQKFNMMVLIMNAKFKVPIKDYWGNL